MPTEEPRTARENFEGQLLSLSTQSTAIEKELRGKADQLKKQLEESEKALKSANEIRQQLVKQISTTASAGK